MNFDAIDRLVAERVMGWPVVDCATGPELGEPRAEYVVMGPFAKTPDGFRALKLWRPSQDIAAAWEVANNLGRIIIVHEPGLYCTIYASDRAFEDGTSLATAPRAPLAICLAALQVRGLAVPS